MHASDDEKSEQMTAWLLSHYGAAHMASAEQDAPDGNDVAAYIHGRLPAARAALIERAMLHDPVLAAAVADERQLLRSARNATRMRVCAAAAAVLVVAFLTVEILSPVVPWDDSMHAALRNGDAHRIAELVHDSESAGQNPLRALAQMSLGDDVGGHPFSSPAVGRRVMRDGTPRAEFMLPRDFVTSAATHFIIRGAPRGARLVVHTLGSPQVELLNVRLPESGAERIAIPAAPLAGGRLSAELLDVDGHRLALTTWVVDKQKEARLEEALTGSARLLAEGPARRLVTANVYLHHGFAAEAAQLIQSEAALTNDARAQRTLERAHELAGLQP